MWAPRGSAFGRRRSPQGPRVGREKHGEGVRPDERGRRRVAFLRRVPHSARAPRRPSPQPSSRDIVVEDASAQASMKSAASCETSCDTQDLANHRILERLTPGAGGRGCASWGATLGPPPSPWPRAPLTQCREVQAVKGDRPLAALRRPRVGGSPRRRNHQPRERERRPADLGPKAPPSERASSASNPTGWRGGQCMPLCPG